ncbi:MAG: sterol desaturase family protein [Ignavibacteria bacterium]|nr:sterol desaturase family protein [Ignavibacteria bacterium]MBT8383084.1 sterol desaturase family protein [Ignavibacteria bacterium]MBT8392377.1 sterol desaturase family protein [Ignavibacteria bacterium]NNJ52956.1 fatty acid hydroxylase [Ignavibacteriaceae bacterium]NNL22199.1 fatty acid hydroxylase [Ignavibacteriaceae bacterium]
MGKNFVSNKDETVRMFDNDFLEAFSRVHFSIPIIIYLPVIAVLTYLSVGVYNLAALTIAGLFLAGIAAWTLTEYILHRFIFHFPAKSKFGKKIHFMFHGVHHDYPSDSKRLVMPPSVSIPLAVLFYFIFLAIFGQALMLPFFAGFILGYLFYDITHYAIHHFNMHNKFWLAIKNHHMLHHFQDEYKGYGVSSPFWDVIFRSNFDKK